jgi:hypothetical protein
MKTIAKPIEMISWTQEDGRIRPIKFKITAHDDEKKVYQVMKIYTTELDRIAGNKVYRYTCEIHIDSLTKLCEIRYELDSCRWILFKI